MGTDFKHPAKASTTRRRIASTKRSGCENGEHQKGDPGQSKSIGHSDPDEKRAAKDDLTDNLKCRDQLSGSFGRQSMFNEHSGRLRRCGKLSEASAEQDKTERSRQQKGNVFEVRHRPQQGTSITRCLQSQGAGAPRLRVGNKADNPWFPLRGTLLPQQNLDGKRRYRDVRQFGVPLTRSEVLRQK